MLYLIDAGWKRERKVELPERILSLNPSDAQRKFLENFWGLSINDIKGNRINFFVEEEIENPFGQSVNLFNIFLKMLADLSESGISISNGIPFCELPYAQDFSRIVVDDCLNFFNICGDDALFIGRGPWWAVPIIYSNAGLTDMYLSAEGGVEVEDRTLLFNMDELYK